MSEMKYLIGKNGEAVMPITSVNAVRDESGNTLNALLTPESLGNGIGICSTSAETLAKEVDIEGYKITQNGFVSITFENDVPSGSTLNINSQGAKPIYHKNAPIEDDVISSGDTVLFGYDGTNYVVSSLGGGSSVEIVEYLSINLTCNEPSAVSGLIGATVVVTDDDNSETILSTTWQGTILECTISVGINYTITVGSVAEYQTPQSRTFKARSGYQRTETFEYYFTTYVDLGLPSGLKWATSNLGAANPEDIGLYFSWGNVVGHESGTYNFTNNYSSTPGYNLTGNVPTNATYDAARAMLGGSWRLPTLTECSELINNTDHEIVTVENKYCGKYMKKTDHSVYVLFPCGGRIESGTNPSYLNSLITVWASTYINQGNSNAIQWYMPGGQTNYNTCEYLGRALGANIRGVR